MRPLLRGDDRSTGTYADIDLDDMSRWLPLLASRVQAEKAIRLQKAGLRTLFLCHNVLLAQHVTRLTAGAGVRVQDIATWVRELSGRHDSSPREWTAYDEPDDSELGAAFDAMTTGAGFDAVVVDEGQDFRDTWWMLVDAALDAGAAKILYVFFDDHQRLLPHRGVPDIMHAPFSLARNCRNAGAIFELVRRCNPNAPDMERELSGMGVLRGYRCEQSSRLKTTVRQAVREAIAVLPPEQLVVITTEPGTSMDSALHGLVLDVQSPWSWPVSVRHYLRTLIRCFGAREIEAPLLSDMSEPTPDDVEAVQMFARPYMAEHPVPDMLIGRRPSWRANGSLLSLGSAATHPTLLARFFAGAWQETLPPPESIQIRSGLEQPGSGISLYSSAEYKGLESPGVILYAPRVGREPRQTPELYIGVSRARALLHIILDQDAPADLVSSILRRQRAGT